MISAWHRAWLRAVTVQSVRRRRHIFLLVLSTACVISTYHYYVKELEARVSATARAEARAEARARLREQWICIGTTPLTEEYRLLRNGIAGQSDVRAIPTTRSTLRASIEGGRALPLLTLFSTWADNEDKAEIRRLTLRNWQQLQPFVRPVLFSDSRRLRAEAETWGWSTLPVTASALGIPLLKHMYRDAMGRFNSSLYAYANGDLLFTDSLVDTLRGLLSSSSALPRHSHAVAATGVRTNVKFVADGETETLRDVESMAAERGTPMSPFANDYFITDRTFPWEAVPDMVIGRIGWDNWMTSQSRLSQGVALVDVTETLLAVHQTTHIGNREGWTHSNFSYNWEMMNHTELGQLSIQHLHDARCASWNTQRDATPGGNVHVVKRSSQQLEKYICQIC